MRKEIPNGLEASNGREGFVVVLPIDLRKTSRYQTCFEATVRFAIIDPATSDNGSVLWARNQNPSLVR